ncbi:hypothetical protein [Burkholderia vietnamiensis]|uniref:hypothetical protein n=1 Tax=Burkholderia vietnamiensis TaxID=60552 RepID=UPI0007564295|nr:hypothetical protein [Burkholderia vietnamiensis]KVF65160.1 hypothetical protein WJ17_22395 [Burkholderia vietnamiensis]
MKTLSLYFRLSRRARDNSLCDDIAHPLVHLMNGAVRGGSMAGPNDSLAAHSVLNKGRLPLSGGEGRQIDPNRIAAHVLKVVQRFGPRVEVSLTQVHPFDREGARPSHVLRFLIRSVAREGDEPTTVQVELDCLSGNFSVCDDR